MHPKTHHLPSPASETDKRQERGEGSFFPSQKESNHRNVWIYGLEDGKETQQHDFENKRKFEIKKKRKIRKFILERTKNCLKKKEQNKKQTVFVWTHFLFDNDLNSLYFHLLFYYNNTIAGTNWWTNLFPLLRGTPLVAIYPSLRYTFSPQYK